MSEEDVREGLRAAVADEPPLVFDPDAVVDTARKATRRRALVAVGVATAAIAVAAVAVPTLNRGTNDGTAPVASQPTTVATSTPPTWPPPGITPAHYTAAQLRARGEEMGRHLQGAVPAALPAASAIEVGEFGGEATGDFSDGQNYVNAPVTFTFDGARYSLFVTAWAPGVTDPSPETVCGQDCQDLGYRDGGPAVVKTESYDNGGTIMTAYHFRTNGGVVQIAAYNYDMSGTTAPVYMPSIPVTVDQLVALATDPELGL